MREANLPPENQPRRKVQAWTRSKLYRTRRLALEEAKAAERLARRKAKSASWRDQKRQAAFEGIDPARTLDLIGDES